MSDRFGLFLSAGKTRIPARFYGTMRLADEHEVPAAPPRTSGLDMLPGEFHTRIDITFDLLLKLGFVPVDPTHPSYPLYLDALAAHDQAAQAEQDAQPLVPDSLAGDLIRIPFQTTFALTPEMWLGYGLVPPRRNAGAARDRTNGQAASRRDATPLPAPLGPSAPRLPLHLSVNPGANPVGGKRDRQFPWMPAQKPILPDRTGGGGPPSSADRDRLSVGPTANSLGPLPTDDFEAFLDFLGDPERRTPSATSGRSAPTHEAAQEALDPSTSTTRAAAANTTNTAPTASGASEADGIVALHEVAASTKARQPPNGARDAIRPVYPVEIGIGIVAAGVAGGLGAGARAVGGAIIRQLVPRSRLIAGDTPAEGAAVTEKPSGHSVAVGKQNDTHEAATPAATAKPKISPQKQAGHVRGTPQYRNRLKDNPKTSFFDGSAAEADALAQEAWEKGTPVFRKPNIRDYDFGRRIGTAPDGKGQSIVRVTQDSIGRIHGHPYGWKEP